MIKFRVLGRPGPSGSKSGFIKNGKVVMAPASKYQKPWKDSVRWAFMGSEFYRMIPFDKGVEVAIEFVCRRPDGQYKANGQPNPKTYRKYPYKRTLGDVDKLVRATNDALEGLVFKNDKQVVKQINTIVYGEYEGATIIIKEMI